MRQNVNSPLEETPGRTARHVGASLLALGLAAASLTNPGVAEPLPPASIARMAQLPSGGLQAVETTDGELLFFSLSDCARRRAREMVRRGRATWISTTPPIIRLTEKPS